MKRYIIFYGWGPKQGGAKDSFFWADDLVEAVLRLSGAPNLEWKDIKLAGTTFQWAHAFDTEQSKVVAEWEKRGAEVVEVKLEEVA